MYSSVNEAELASAVSTSGQRWVVKCNTPRMYAQISMFCASPSGIPSTLVVEFVEHPLGFVVVFARDHAGRVREPDLGQLLRV